MELPNVFVIAGPNGIGKTTSAFYLIPANTPLINSDEIAATLSHTPLPPLNVQEFANSEAIRIMNRYIDQKTSFAIETNLADVETWKFLIELQKKGYQINLLYLSSDSLSLLNSRIEERVRAGEHYVRPDIVRERYINGLKLLNHYFKIPDIICLVDNSVQLQFVAEIHKGKIIKMSLTLPDWVKKNLTEHFEQKQEEKRIRDMNSIAEVKKAYQQKKGKGPTL